MAVEQQQLGSVKARLLAARQAALGRGRCLAGHLDSAKLSSVFQLQLGSGGDHGGGGGGDPVHLALDSEGGACCTWEPRGSCLGFEEFLLFTLSAPGNLLLTFDSGRHLSEVLRTHFPACG